jgi:cyclase
LPADVQVPHIGWNALEPCASHPLLRELPAGAAAYFVHSYAPLEVPPELWLAATTHGVRFPAVAGSGRVLGMQFHPEKSAAVGEALLRGFLRLATGATSPPASVASEPTSRGRGSAAPPTFTLFPAIDLRQGRVVRLLRGVDATRQVYGEDPLATAAGHARDGARWLHVVDLDAAFGEAPQHALLAALLALPGRPALQLGGGLRSVEAAERALALGVERVVVGTLLVSDPAAFAALARRFPGRVVPALDVAAGRVRVAGWTAEGPPWEEVARTLRGLPCPAVLVTAVDRDGTLAGPDLALTAAVGECAGLPALVSGGVATLDDLRCAAADPGVGGAVVGRALYAGAFDLPAALAAVEESGTAASSRSRRSGLLARVIPCLDVAAGRVVKGVRFAGLADQGDPAAVARRYAAQGADELVFLDVGATHEGRDTGLAWVEAVAREVAIPLTVGGGVRTVEDARRLLLAGADKVAVNSAAVADPGLLAALAERFGRQCVVLAVDAARVPGAGARWEVRTHGGRRPTGRDAIEWIVEGVARGAGEVLLTSIDADGTRSGYDLPLLAAASSRVDVPLIASGGAGGLADLAPALRAGASAVLAASLFHLGEATVGEAKDYLAACGIAVRRDALGAPRPGAVTQEPAGQEVAR